MNEVAVIGGAGFIGRSLVAELVARGNRVRVISRRPPSRTPQAGVTVRAGDVARLESLRSALEGASLAVCLSAGGGASWEDFERDFIQGAKNVVTACGELGVRRLIYASSIAALYLGGRKPVDHQTPPDPYPLSRSFYARAKILAEQTLSQTANGCGLETVIVRPGVVLGPGGTLQHGGLGQWPSDVHCIGWGTGRHPLPLVLVEDVTAAIAAALERPGLAGTALNLVGDVRLSAREFIFEFRTRARRDIRFYPRPLCWLQAIEIIKWAVKLAARKPGNLWPSYRDLKSRSLRAPIDCRWEKDRLGWRPVSDRETFLRQAIDANLTPIPAGDLRRPESLRRRRSE